MNVLRILPILFVLLGTLHAQTVPLSISFQAVLTDDAGNLLEPDQPTNHNIELRIFDSAQAGNLLWSEAQTVSVFKGGFSTLLGTGDDVGSEPRPALDAVFNQADRFLEVTLLGGSSPEVFSPRQQLVSTPYAFRAKTADVAVSVSAGVVSEGGLATGSVTNGKLGTSAVTTAKLADQAVEADKIATGAVGTAQLANGGVDLDDLAATIMKRLVPAGSVSAWAGHEQARTINGVAVTGPPEGWLLCQGQVVSKVTYPDLFAVLGHTYSLSGDDLTGTDFRLPDYRGMFLRGQAGNATQDPDVLARTQRPWLASANLYDGSLQADQFKSHTHGENAPRGTNWLQVYARGNGTWGGERFGGDDRHPSDAAGGSETRPKNTYIHYIIKAH